MEKSNPLFIRFPFDLCCATNIISKYLTLA